MAKPAKRKKKQPSPSTKSTKTAAQPQAPSREERGSLAAQMRTAREQIDVDNSSNPWLLISALVATALFMFVYYHVMALQQMAQLSDGLAMLDQRFFGYGVEDVQQLAQAMNQDALGQLNWTHKTAGIIFPLAFGIAAASVIAMVVPGSGRRTIFTGKPARITLWSLIGLFVVADIAENFLIEAALQDPTGGVAGFAATLTVLRWVLLALIVGYSIIAFGASKVRNFSRTAGGV